MCTRFLHSRTHTNAYTRTCNSQTHKLGLGVLVTDLGSITLHHEQTLVIARQFASRVAALLGLDPSDGTRVATAVSEIARNAFRYAAGGEVRFSIDRDSTPAALVVSVSDRGPGITSLADVLAGRLQSPTGAGAGISGARRLMDEFTIESARGRGTTVTMRKRSPASAPPLTDSRLDGILRALEEPASGNLLEEFERQNRELLRALAELQARQQELVRLNRELEDTNRGVVRSTRSSTIAPST